MKKLFIDTSALYAVMDGDDRNHMDAAAAMKTLLDQSVSLTTSNYVLLESMALIQRRLGMSALCDFLRDFVPVMEIAWISPELHSIAVSSLLAAGQRDLSLVDCSSFELMRQEGIRAAFTYDNQFQRHGFSAHLA